MAGNRIYACHGCVNAYIRFIDSMVHDKTDVYRCYVDLLLGTVIAACAVNFPMLLTGRMIQAVGTGLLIPIIMNALLLIYRPEVRGKIMGTFGLVIMFAPAIGPTLSGVIVDILGWRWLFIIVIPFAVFSILFAVKYLQNVGEATRPRADFCRSSCQPSGSAESYTDSAVPEKLRKDFSPL